MCGGRKLLEWPLISANNAECVDRVFLSTDDEEMKQIGRDYGATILDRPWQFATDMASNGSMVLHAWSEIYKICQPRHIVMLYPTSPLVEAKHIDGAYELLISKGNTADTVYSMHRLNKTSWLGNLYTINPDHALFNFWGFHGAPFHIANNLFPVYVAGGALSIFEIEPELFIGLPELDDAIDTHILDVMYAQKMAEREVKNNMLNIIKRIGYEVDEAVETDINYPMDLAVADGLLRYRENLYPKFLD